MAKKKVSSDDKKAIKTTVIVLFLFALAAGIFLFLNKDKEVARETKARKSVKVVTGKDVRPVQPQTVRRQTTPPSAAKTSVPIASKKLAGSIPSSDGAKIAFIIDDWGYRLNTCRFLKEIKAPIAVAVLPNLRYSNDVMKCASVYNKEIMLHLPMEPYHTGDRYPDYYLITTTMPRAKVEAILEETFKKMPLITGVNNHMGSKATEDSELMKIVLKKVRKKGLFFVDSMTAPKGSVAWKTAQDLRVPYAKRDIFLDNVNTREAIQQQIIAVAEKARTQGYAIAIGHDRPLTLQVLVETIPILQKQGFEIVRVKDLLKRKN